MPGTSSIEWTERTWNPTTGCTKVSPGCAHCYAETFAERWRGTPDHPYEQGFDLRLWPERLDVPLRWRKPSVIFVNSMSDLFHEDIPAEFIGRVFATMERADWHTFQVLTKRPERAVDLAAGLPWPSNVWMGTTIESGRYADRADALRQIPASVRFISAEPLLGPLGALSLDGVDWLITGGESGSHLRKRPYRFLVHPDGSPRADRADWLRDLRDRCAEEGIAYFFKQWGGRSPKAGGRELDGRTWSDYPVVGATIHEPYTARLPGFHSTAIGSAGVASFLGADLDAVSA